MEAIVANNDTYSLQKRKEKLKDNKKDNTYY